MDRATGARSSSQNYSVSVLLVGLVLSCAAIWLAGRGGSSAAAAAGFSAAFGLALLSPTLRADMHAVRIGLFDALVVAAYGALADPSAVLWRAPDAWAKLFAFTAIGASFASFVYIGALLVIMTYAARRPNFVASAAIALTPFAFCLFIGLGSRLPADFARLLLGGVALAEPYAAALGRALWLAVLNEAIIAGAAIALGRRMPRDPALHVTLFVAAFFAAATPLAATFGSSAFVAGLGAPWSLVVMAVAAALAQAGLWGETYLVTQAIVDLLHGAPPISRGIRKPWASGMAKGAIYGLVFMGLVAAAGAFVANRSAVALLLVSGLAGATLLGALFFPLARTILESTDSTSPFFGRLLMEMQRLRNYPRGMMVGAAIALGAATGVPALGGGERFLFGFAAGALAYAGVDAISDLAPILTGRRRYMSSLRIYLFGAVLGGITGGAIAWYFDAGQIDVVVKKFFAYTAVHYPSVGRAVSDYNIFPLFSKWGVTNLGPVEGGVKLFYLESLSGVIQWIFAAPLFSINLFFLTALVKRDLKPLRALFSEEGARQLVDNAVLVLRWGLWMAPVIYTFLKASGEPAWYNQDGLVRTGVASLMAAASTPAEFATWSLSIFTGLLAYDWLRVLIWFDHMGLRVATLVNLSFVGGDLADERAARFVGKAQVSRAVPVGLRRFGTWAPLLLPFYIPRGADWDKAWGGAERLRSVSSPVTDLLLGYTAVAGAATVGLSALILRRLSRAGRRRAGGGTGTAGTPTAKPYRLTNGLFTSEWYDDGQSFSRLESAARRGPAIDITRRPDDPAQPRGKFVYLREGDGELWSLGAAPVFAGGEQTDMQRTSPTQLFIARTRNGLRVEATIEVVDGEAAEVMRVKIVNLERRPRRIMVSSLREWVVNEGGVEKRDPGYNGIHVGTWFLREPAAIIAQNRLLKTGERRASRRRMSPEVAFHAAGAGATGEVRLIGYEDMKSRFYGLGMSADPDSMTGRAHWRDPSDEGLLYGFEPCASLTWEARIAPESTAEILFVDGWAQNMDAALASIARRLDAPLPAPERLSQALARTRAVKAGAPSRELRFAFAPDGKSLRVSPGTPRPFAHVIANAFGQGAVLTNDGDIFSFFGNARQNSLTPFRMGEGRWSPVGQAIFVKDMASGEAHCATFAPLRRTDATFEVEFGLGTVVYTSRCGDLELEETVFTPPERTVEVKILRIRNTGAGDRMFLVSPIAEIVLAETQDESLDQIEIERDDSGQALYFRNPKNYFVKGWAFATTSLPAEFAETSRRRAFGAQMRGARLPYMADHGHPDINAGSSERRVAAFAGAIEVKANGEQCVAFSLGQTGDLAAARHFAAVARSLEWAAKMLDRTKSAWADQLGQLRIETNRPDFDRLVNDWLPYQLLASRLWGRTGPAQRSGATGYRDQLQDVLPLVFLAPELARRQILLHAARQFLEGDAVKWWHTAPGGGAGLADRTHSSDPHLWLPFVAMRYVEATGDEAVLDVAVPFIEGEHTPKSQEGQADVPIPSREAAKLFDHCALAIEWTLARMGRHGLPLMGTGDWDDGMNLVGFEGRGESVWVGFFLHGILMDFARVAEKRGKHALVARYRGQAEELRAALDACWRGDRYLRAYADNGKEIAPVSAMTSSWPVLSRAVDFKRGVEVVENALATLQRPDRVLLVSPPYTEESDPFPGRSAEYPPGVRENGGQYSHGVSWFVDALAELADQARQAGDAKESARLSARAFEVWVAISPLSKFPTPEAADNYGLPPHQQPADVYEGPGYEGRGGWSWYTGSAARMLVAAYRMLGLRLEKGEFSLAPDAFQPKGGLQLRRATWRGRTFTAAKERKASV